MKKHHKSIDRTGEKHTTNQGYEIEIIEYTNNENCTVQFKNGFISKNKRYCDITRGEIGNPYHPSVYGTGYMGVGKYKTCINKKTTLSYSRWVKIMERGHSYTKKIKNPSYKDVTVCKEWHNFQVFAQWFDETYNLEIMKEWQIDKDILEKGNKIYSPETCCFVPQEVNQLFVKNDISRGDLPIGVSKHVDGSYVAQLTRKNRGRYLGYFDTPEKAFLCYKFHKEVWIKEIANKWRGKITEECYWAMMMYEVEITD